MLSFLVAPGERADLRPFFLLFLGVDKKSWKVPLLEASNTPELGIVYENPPPPFFLIF